MCAFSSLRCVSVCIWALVDSVILLLSDHRAHTHAQNSPENVTAERFYVLYIMRNAVNLSLSLPAPGANEVHRVPRCSV